MKITKISLAAIAMVVAITSVPSAASAQRSSSQAAVTRCENRVKLLTGFKADMELFRKNYYLKPSESDMANYEKKDATQIDGKKRPTQSEKGKVKIYKDGKLVDAVRPNYTVFLERHLAARDIANNQSGMQAKEVYKKYVARTSELRKAIDEASSDIDQDLQGWADGPKNIDCKTKKGRENAAQFASTRAANRKEANTNLKDVRAKAKEVSAAYREVAKEYRTTARANR